MKAKEDIKSILIIGIAGGLAQITCKLLYEEFPNAKITGVDSRDINHIKHIPNIDYETIKYTGGNFEKLFRNHRFDVVYHLGRLSHATLNTHNSLAKRLDLSVMGTNKIFDLCLKFEVSKLIILSTFHVYGAYPDNPVFMSEEFPLRAIIKHPELRDVVEMDRIATNLMWKNQNSIETVVLRPCNIIGAQIRNAISQYLSYKHSPYPIDFNPTFQFLHEFDMAMVLKRAALELPTGIFNVAPDEIISIRDALKICGNDGIPMCMSILGPISQFLKIWDNPLPEYLIDYLKFSCLIDNSHLKKYLGADFCRFKTEEALNLIKLI